MIAADLVWKMKPMDDENGYYVLRSNLNHADAKEVVDIFNMLEEPPGTSPL